jgi:hypothetical protein
VPTGVSAALPQWRHASGRRSTTASGLVGVQLAPVEAPPRRLRLRRAVRPVGLLALRRRQAGVVRGRRVAELLQQQPDLVLKRRDAGRLLLDPCGQRPVLRLELAVAGLEPLDPRIPLHQQVDELVAGEMVVRGGPSFHARGDGRGNRIGRTSPPNGGITPAPDRVTPRDQLPGAAPRC